ncbi:uncharacterized protein LOC126985637 [Eriocheir sinensis]|uniref:uncharacterized protein LOC126985637 n=1 Tax=Eriocheir sinensis TaxID=95602 RepID=UPI0021CA77F3|nr:uncharacterized protein LOC126985637 [Eriocheir sinensis]
MTRKASFPCLLPRGNIFPYLLLLVMALGQATDVNPSLTMSCTDTNMVLGEWKIRSTPNETKESRFYLDKTVYVWPEEGFRGIGVIAVAGSASGQRRVDAWFSKDSLFTNVTTAKWWELWVYVHRESDRIKFSVYLGEVWKVCVTWVTSDNLQSLEVMGYGPSRCRDTMPPPGCPYEGYNVELALPQTKPNCTVHPPISGATPTTMTTTGSVVAGVVVGMVAAAVVVVVMLCRTQRHSEDENTSPRPSPTAGAHREGIHVIENSLYESFEACRDAATTETPPEGIHVIENRLYESIEACRDRATAGELN